MRATRARTIRRRDAAPRFVSSVRLATAVGLVVSLGVACTPPPPAPAPPTPKSTTPAKPPATTVPKPPSCPPAGGASVASSSTESASPPLEPTEGLSPDEAYTRAFEAADQSRAEQVSSGAGSPSPVAITSVDQFGRPQIRQVTGADFNSTTAAAVGVVEQSFLAGEAVLDVATDPTVSNADTTEAATDPNRWYQWALDEFPFEAASQAVAGEENVVVAVLDSGIAVDHPDLKCVVTTSKAFTSESISVPGSHATHVAGIIAANANNGLGIAGATPAVHLLNGKVLDSSGNGFMSDAAAGIVWAVDNGAKVINMSLAGTSASTAMSTALDYAESHNVVVVAAAGNDGLQADPPDSWPAANPLTIAVASLDQSGDVSGFSTHASYVDVAAPGGLIYSTTINGGYIYKSGTSMATPYVSALAALTIARGPSATAAQVRSAISSNATDIGAPGFDDASGWGKINLAPLLTP